MKAVMIDSPGKLKIVEVPKPEPKHGEVLVKLRSSGICGTDIEKLQGEGITTKILGHETVGVVEQVGTGVEEIEVGDRVFTHHHVPCLRCDLCERRRYTYCAEYLKHNLVPCGLVEHYIVPSFNVERGAVLELPDSLGFEEASFIEPLACCILGLEEAEAKSVSSALVYGAGPVGVMHMKLLKSYGIGRVGIADVSEYRLALASGMGADVSFNPTNIQQRGEALARFEKGPQLVVVATPSTQAFEEAARVVGQAGTVLLFGAPRKGSTTTLDMERFFLNGTRFVTSYAASENETSAAMELLAERRIVVDDLITHRFPLASSAEAFAVASQQQCMKAIITD